MKAVLKILGTIFLICLGAVGWSILPFMWLAKAKEECVQDGPAAFLGLDVVVDGHATLTLAAMMGHAMTLFRSWRSNNCVDPRRNLDPLSINGALLHQHVQVGACIAAAHLRDGV
jgi:hypothetical protein